MAPLTTLRFLREQLCGMPPMVEADLTNKTVIVVGANAGIGFEAAKHFANMNPGRLILACRSQQKGEAALSGKWFPLGFAHLFNSFKISNHRLGLLVSSSGLLTSPILHR